MRRGQANRRILVVVAVGAVLVAAGILGALGPVRWLYAHTIAPVAGGLTAAG